MLKQLAARLPVSFQTELKRLHFRRQLSRGAFSADEPEFEVLHQLVKPGDWVVDIGANVGHYTRRLSELVGASGRVIAVEPVPTTFSLLAANCQHFPLANVTLVNVAASDHDGLVRIALPSLPTGLVNYYQAHVVEEGTALLSVLATTIDGLALRHRVSLVKIDAEGHERQVLAGMRGLIEKWHPTLIVETESPSLAVDMERLGYRCERLPGSPNLLCRAVYDA